MSAFGPTTFIVRQYADGTTALVRHSLSAWNAETPNRDLLRQDAKAMRAHPGFKRAGQQFALNTLEAVETPKPLNRLLRGERELALLAFVLALHPDFNLKRRLSIPGSPLAVLVCRADSAGVGLKRCVPSDH